MGPLYTLSCLPKKLMLMWKAPKLIMGRIPKELMKITVFENFGQTWANFVNKWHFLWKYDLFKIIFFIITWARIKLQIWNLMHVCRKKLHKTCKKWKVLICSILIAIGAIGFLIILKSQLNLKKMIFFYIDSPNFISLACF